MASRSHAGQYRRQDSGLSRYVAQGGSRTLGGAHAKELRTWATARQFIACYAVPRALRAIEQLRACIADVVKPVTTDRVIQADAADCAEDAAQTKYLLNPTPQTQETYIRALYAEAAESTALARDLAATQGDRFTFSPDATAKHLAWFANRSQS